MTYISGRVRDVIELLWTIERNTSPRPSRCGMLTPVTAASPVRDGRSGGSPGPRLSGVEHRKIGTRWECGAAEAITAPAAVRSHPPGRSEPGLRHLRRLPRRAQGDRHATQCMTDTRAPERPPGPTSGTGSPADSRRSLTGGGTHHVTPVNVGTTSFSATGRTAGHAQGWMRRSPSPCPRSGTRRRRFARTPPSCPVPSWQVRAGPHPVPGTRPGRRCSVSGGRDGGTGPLTPGGDPGEPGAGPVPRGPAGPVAQGS